MTPQPEQAPAEVKPVMIERFPARLHQQMKMAALTRGTSVREAYVAAAEEWLAAHEAGRQP